MSASDDANSNVVSLGTQVEGDGAEEKWIYLPDPKGHKCSSIVFQSGTPFFADCSLEELKEKVTAFLSDPEAQLLELIDASNGYPAYFTRRGVQNAIVLNTQWVTHPPLPQAEGGRIAVAHGLPTGLSRAQRRHNGRG